MFARIQVKTVITVDTVKAVKRHASCITLIVIPAQALRYAHIFASFQALYHAVKALYPMQ
jgi:hypothetical protein